jgi:hypothetical protein
VDRLLIIGCGIPVIRQDQVGPGPVAEPLQLKIQSYHQRGYFCRSRSISRGVKNSRPSAPAAAPVAPLE